MIAAHVTYVSGGISMYIYMQRKPVIFYLQYYVVVPLTGSRKRDVDDILTKHPHKVPVSHTLNNLCVECL